MATVWRAWHPARDEPVAVKVMRVSADSSGLAGAIANEAWAVARLDHPNIIELLDQGVVDSEAARRSQGVLREASPYLAMELVPGAALDQLRTKLEWEELQPLIAQLLSALAHAHSRGVIHRDIKPANVLFNRTTKSTKLLDFGVAHAMDQHEDDTTHAGTPNYMAPEQVCDDSWTHGPWTDLYSLGCLVWAMVCGRSPIQARTLGAARHFHLIQNLPAFEPALPCPRELYPWLTRLLASPVSIRYRRAADALWGLPPADAPLVDPVADRTDRTNTLAAATVVVATEASTPQAGSLPDWSELSRPSRPRPGLTGLRPVPLTGRTEVRDRLWGALHEVRESGAPHVIALVGDAGSGKTKLAHWLLEKAHETGAATVLSVANVEGTSSNPGPARLLASYLRCGGDDPREVRRRARIALLDRGIEDRELALAVAELIAPADPDGSTRFRGRSERLEVVGHVLQQLGGRRPLVVVVDDAQWDDGCVELAKQMAVSGGGPILFVLTFRTDVGSSVDTQSGLRFLGSSAEQIPVGPLSQEEHLALVRSMLSAEPALAERVAEQTHGSPLFAIQMVHDLAQRGELTWVADSWRLVQDRAELPDDLHAIWVSRLEALAASRSEAEVRLLELAALGPPIIDAAEWAAAAAHEERSIPADLFSSLISSGFIVEATDGRAGDWSFCHGMLREELVRRARAAERLAGHHHAWAHALSDADRIHRNLLRIIEHLIGAGELDDAMVLMRRWVRGRLRAGDLSLVDRMLSWVRSELELGTDSDEAAHSREPASRWCWGTYLTLRSAFSRHSGKLEAAEQYAQRAIEIANLDGQPTLRFEAQLCAYHLAYRRGEYADASAHLAGIEELATADLARAEWCYQSAWVAMALGDLERALSTATETTELSNALALGPRRIGDCHHLLGSIRSQLGRRSARDDFRRAVKCYEESGSRRQVGMCLLDIGDLARIAGDLDDARANYRDAKSILAAVDPSLTCIADINMSLAHILLGKFARAEATLEDLLDSSDLESRPGLLAAVHLCLAAATAGQADWRRSAVFLSRAESQISASSAADAEHARVAEKTAQLMVVGGQTALARHAYEVAQGQWRALGRLDEVSRLEQIIEAEPGAPTR